MPAQTELSTKAMTLYRYTLIPTDSAAISLPCTARSVRPIRERNRFMASNWQTSATAPISQKYSVAVISRPLGSVGAGMDMIPIGPPVRLQRFAVTSAMKPKAIVTTARYGPLARSDGSASSAPKTPASAMPSGALIQNGTANFVASSAVV